MQNYRKIYRFYRLLKNTEVKIEYRKKKKKKEHRNKTSYEIYDSFRSMSDFYGLTFLISFMKNVMIVNVLFEMKKSKRICSYTIGIKWEIYILT